MTEDVKIRMGGLLCLAGALPLAYFLIARPLQQAYAGAPQISLDIKGAFALVPMLTVYGLAFVIGGENVKYRDVSHHPPKMTPMGWALMVLSLAFAGVCYWWVESQFSALGYR